MRSAAAAGNALPDQGAASFPRVRLVPRLRRRFAAEAAAPLLRGPRRWALGAEAGDRLAVGVGDAEAACVELRTQLPPEERRVLDPAVRATRALGAPGALVWVPTFHPESAHERWPPRATLTKRESLRDANGLPARGATPLGAGR